MKKLPDKIIIYTLSDPITLDIRYVGITSKTLEYRYKRHFYDKKNYKKRKWFKQLDDISLRPIIEELDVVDFDGWEFWEKWYISLFKSFGFDLVNLTEGGEGMFGYIHTEETKQKIREKRKLQIFTEKTLDKLSEVNMGNLKAFNKKHSKEVNILKSKNQRGKFGGTILKISVDGNIEKFDSISDAGDSIGLKQNNIWYACRERKDKLYKGFYWKYENENEIQSKNSDKISYDILYRMYIKEKISGQKIADIYGCSGNKIYSLLKKYNLMVNEKL